MSKTPKRKAAEKDNVSVASAADSVSITTAAKRSRKNQDTHVIAIVEGERELRSVTKTYTMKFSSRMSIDSDASEYLNADSNDTADRLQQSKRVSTPAAKTKPVASSSSSASAPRRGRQKKDATIVNIEPSKRPDGYWAEQPTDFDDSIDSNAVLSAENLTAQQSIQRDWSEEASGKIRRANKNKKEVAAATRVTVDSSSSSSGHQWTPVREPVREEPAVEPVIAATTATAATVTQQESSSSSSYSYFALLVLLLLVFLTFGFNKAREISDKIPRQVIRSVPAAKTSLLPEHLLLIEKELVSGSQSFASYAAQLNELNLNLEIINRELSGANETLRGLASNVSADHSTIASEKSVRDKAVAEVKAVSAAAAKVKPSEAVKLPIYEYTLCDPAVGHSNCKKFNNDQLIDLTAEAQRIIAAQAAEIDSTKRDVREAWQQIESTLSELVISQLQHDAKDFEGQDIAIIISDAVEELAKSHLSVESHVNLLSSSIEPSLIAAIQVKAEAAIAAAKAIKEEEERSKHAHFTKHNHLLDSFVKQKVSSASILSALEQIEEASNSEDDEAEVEYVKPNEASEGIVDYAVAPRGGIVVNSDRLTSPHYCRACEDNQIADKESTSSSPFVKAAQSLGKAVASVLQDPKRRHSAEAARRTLLSHSVPQLEDTAYTFRGSKGHVTVKMFAAVNVSQVSIVHVVGSSDELLSAAPREVRFRGFTSDPLTAQHSYDLGILKVIAPTKAATAGSLYTRTLEVASSVPPLVAVSAEVLNNYGNREFTSLYRIKVMGELIGEY